MIHMTDTATPRMKVIGEFFLVKELAMQLDDHPELWNERTYRTDRPTSPHRESDDIWVRFRDPSDLSVPDPQAEHASVWYPCVEKIPAARTLAGVVLQTLGASPDDLGGVLITRVPAHKQIYPHTDHGWHARHYKQFGLQIKGNHFQAFHFEDEEMKTEPGDLFQFNNKYPHWVTNNSMTERITMIMSIRVGE